MIIAWKDRHRSVSGHQGACDLREIVNAILYQGRTGCQWAYLPHDLPQRSATYYYFAAWRDDGTDQVIHELLRCQVTAFPPAPAAASPPATALCPHPAAASRRRRRPGRCRLC